MKPFVLTISILIISSCASINETVEKLNKAVDDIQYSVTGPQISYTQDYVRVLYRDYRNAPYNQRHVIYLVSDTHNGIVSKAQFKAIKESRNARTFALEAIFPMPKVVPNSAKNSCFHVIDAKTQNANIIAVKPELKSAGFINQIWQANVAKPSQLNYIDETKRSNMRAINQLKLSNSKASEYLKASNIYTDNQCILPENTAPIPLDPNQGLFNDRKYMSYGICHVADYQNIDLGRKYFFYADTTTKKINKYENPNKSFDKSIRFMKDIFSNNDQVAKRKILSEHIDHAQRILNASKNISQNCTSLSKCSTYDELFYGSTHRNYQKNFERCATMIESKISKTAQQFKTKLKAWEQEPIKRQNFCRTQKTVTESYAIKLASIEEQNNILDSEKEKISKIKPYRDANNYWRNSTSATCSIQ